MCVFCSSSTLSFSFTKYGLRRKGKGRRQRHKNKKKQQKHQQIIIKSKRWKPPNTSKKKEEIFSNGKFYRVSLRSCTYYWVQNKKKTSTSTAYCLHRLQNILINIECVLCIYTEHLHFHAFWGVDDIYFIAVFASRTLRWFLCKLDRLYTRTPSTVWILYSSLLCK